MVRCDKEGYKQGERVWSRWRAGYACMILIELIFVDLKANCFEFSFELFWLRYFFQIIINLVPEFGTLNFD